MSASEVSLSCVQSTYHCHCGFVTVGAFPVFDDLASTFDLDIQGSLYCLYVYTFPVFFYLAGDQVGGQGP